MGKAQRNGARAGRGSGPLVLLLRIGRALALGVLAALLLALTLVLALRWIDPPTSTFMLEARAQALAAHEAGYHTEYHWVDLEHISPQAAIAVIAAEDQQFPFHAGFDFKSIREAVRAHERGRKLRGASTISQQVAKNLFLWPGRSFARKGLEAMFTVLIETLWPKERILEVYLNIAEFGRGGARALQIHRHGVLGGGFEARRPSLRQERGQCNGPNRRNRYGGDISFRYAGPPRLAICLKVQSRCSST